MRPIIKGNWPLENGVKVIFKNHREARPFLEHNSGRFCHFCEMPILNAPSVEHIKPKELRANKIKYEHLRTHWDNLLLICHYCNAHKLDKDIKTYHYYWPDKNNTFLLYEYYSVPGIPTLRNSLNAYQASKADETLQLYGLKAKTDSSGGIDIRYSKRIDAIDMAITRLFEYRQVPSQTTIAGIIDNAKSSGFWSVWYEVFINEPVVLDALLSHNDFGHNRINHLFPAPLFQPIPRNPTNPIDMI